LRRSSGSLSRRTSRSRWKMRMTTLAPRTQTLPRLPPSFPAGACRSPLPSSSSCCSPPPSRPPRMARRGAEQEAGPSQRPPLNVFARATKRPPYRKGSRGTSIGRAHKHQEMSQWGHS
jgi:hypothetical protein